MYHSSIKFKMKMQQQLEYLSFCWTIFIMISVYYSFPWLFSTSSLVFNNHPLSVFLLPQLILNPLLLNSLLLLPRIHIPSFCCTVWKLKSISSDVNSVQELSNGRKEEKYARFQRGGERKRILHPKWTLYYSAILF